MMLVTATIEFEEARDLILEGIAAHPGGKPVGAEDDPKAATELNRWFADYQTLQAELHILIDEFHYPLGHPRGLNEKPRTVAGVVSAAQFADYDLPEVPADG